MKALSLREPWATFMTMGLKRIENRSWPTRTRGRVLVHASSWWRTADVLDDYDTACAIAASIGLGPPRFSLEDIKPRRGGIVGAFTILDCVSSSEDPFFFGPYGFVVEDPIRFPVTIQCRGTLGFFDVPPDVEAACRPFLEKADG